MTASDADYALLEHALAAHSDFDLDGLLGIFHAIAVTPNDVRMDIWYPTVFPNGIDGSEDVELDAVFAAIIRVIAAVFDAIAHGATLTPDPDDLSAVRSFARGYAFAAGLDPFWSDDPHRWLFAASAAAVGGMDSLVPEHVLEARALSPDFDTTFAHELDELILEAFESFADVREELRRVPHGVRPPRVRAFRTGRNDPCPCGSGKKFKRCCLNAPEEP